MAEEAILRARAIAARLGSIAGQPEGSGSELGKRKSRWDNDGQTQSFSAPGLGMSKKKKIYVPVNEHPDINFLGLLIGPRGSTQKMLEEKSGAKILIRGKGSSKDGAPPSAYSHPDDNDALHVMIEGTQQAVDIAEAEVQKILYNPEEALRLKREQLRNLAEMNGPRDGFGYGTGANAGTGTGSHYGPGASSEEAAIEIKVPNSMVGLIIGKGGENIQKMQAQCGVHVQIAKETEMKPGDTHRTVTLRGTQDGAEEARRRIEDMIGERMNRGQRANTRDPRSELTNMPFVLMVPVPNDKVGMIIGKNGLTVKTIQETTETVIKIPTQADENDPLTRTIAVGGSTKAATEAAHREIVRVLTPQTQPQAITPMLYMPIPDDKVGIVIGKSGSTIKDLQSRTNTRIQIPMAADPGSDPPMRTLSIQGTQEAAFIARCEIETLLGLPMDSGYGSGSYSQQSYSGYEGGGSFVNDPYRGFYAGNSGRQPDTQTRAPTPASNSDPHYPSSQPIPDPTAYYAEFWNYVSYYGEEAARAAYGAWAPPVGTQPPEGMGRPPTDPNTNGTTSANPDIDMDQSATASGQADPAANPGPTSVPNPTTDSNPNPPSNSGDSTDAWAQWQQYYGQAQGQPAQTQPQGEASSVGVDEEAARKAWEQYYQQYYQYYGHYPQQDGSSNQQAMEPQPPGA